MIDYSVVTNTALFLNSKLSILIVKKKNKKLTLWASWMTELFPIAEEKPLVEAAFERSKLVFKNIKINY